MTATSLPSEPSSAGLTLAGLQRLDVPATWARLTPEQQAEIGEATLAAELAGLVGLTSIDPDRAEADRLEREADRARSRAITAALPEIFGPA